MVREKTPEPPKFGSLLNFVCEGGAARNFCPSDFSKDTSVGLRDSVPGSQSLFEKPPRSRHRGMEIVWPSPRALSQVAISSVGSLTAALLPPEFTPDTAVAFGAVDMSHLVYRYEANAGTVELSSEFARSNSPRGPPGNTRSKQNGLSASALAATENIANHPFAPLGLY